MSDAPAAIACLSTRRRPGCSMFLAESSFMSLLLRGALSADRCERTASGRVDGALGLIEQVCRKTAAGVGLADLEKPPHDLGMLVRQVRRVWLRPRRIVEERAAAVDLAVQPPLVVDHSHRRAPANGDMVTDGRSACKCDVPE